MKTRTELINSLPNDLRERVIAFEASVKEVEASLAAGEIEDYQLANFYTLVYYALNPKFMTKDSDNAELSV